jgi:hypothetical protein
MRRGRKRLRSILLITTMTTGGILVAAPPAHAVCGTVGGTNPITIHIGPLEDPIRIPGTPVLATLCVTASVEGDPNPQVDPDVTVEPGSGCGFPCFVVAWGGVSTGPVTVTVTATVNGEPVTVQRTLPGEGYGAICVNAGMPCPG